MQRLTIVPVAALGLLLIGALTPAPAQEYYNPYPALRYSNAPGINPGGGPRLSPYLNFFRTNPAVDYFLGVVPEIDRRRNLIETRNAFLQLEQGTTSLRPVDEFGTPRAQTGHPVAFMTTAGYFGSGIGGRYAPSAFSPRAGNQPPGNVVPGRVR
jgi:hypothetical protein